MKRIGYIFKYNPSEGLGILVYGTWKVESGWGPWSSSIIKNTPILFSANDLLSEVDTGQLVYFDLDNKTASNIERASLSNFKVEYIDSIIRCKEYESEYSFYSDNTYISFESLDSIIIPNEDIYNQEKKASDESVSSLEDFCDEDLELLDLFIDEDDFTTLGINPTDTNIENTNLPESIVELFNCFGKYKHKNKKDSKSLNVFDLSLWVDQDVLDNEYYGKKVNELKFLYDLFVLKKRYDKKGNEINVKIEDDCISPIWSLLLSKFSDSDLKEIIYEAPKLQPALPIDFCKKNVGALSDDYGMPNVDICKLYCLHKISNAQNVSDYKDIKHKLYVYRNCNATHREGEGVPMCQMGTRRIKHLEKQLEAQYENIIKYNIIAQLKVLSNDVNEVNKIWNCTNDEFNNIGLFIEKYNNLKNNFFKYNVCEEIIESYENLPQLYKDALKSSLLDCANKSVISSIDSEELTPYWLNHHINDLGDWILESTKQKVKELVNAKFSKLNNLEDLHDAYKADYITSIQYYYKYKELTSNFGISQLLEELSDYKMLDSPMVIQWYVVSKIICQLGFQNLNEYNYDNNINSIYNIRSLLEWLVDYGHLKDVVLKKAEEKICSVLSNKEKWTLFEDKITQSPGIENIRKHLDKAYKKKTKNEELFKHACFQDVMLSDVLSTRDLETKLFIADNLDASHQCLMRQKVTGFLKLYLWQKHPSGTCDWNLIKSHFYQLPSEAQIRTLRFIFGEIASSDLSLSIEELYSEFVETITPACPAICGILFILKEKKNDINMSITSSMIESVIGEEQKQRLYFLKDSKEFFYPCNGYFAISDIKYDIDYQSFNGILTKDVKNDELYYVVSFYESPVDLFGKEIEWLLDSDFTDVAKQVLIKNTNAEVINGKYYIHESQEFFVKQFVIAYHIDDKCGLVSDKEKMIELGYLPRNNAYQPLYTNYIRKYEESDNSICRCGDFGGSDPQNNIPFFWCNKKMCVRRGHFLLPPSEWKNYRFADLLFIVLGQSSDSRESVWRVNSEISQFFCDYMRIFRSNDRNIYSKPLNREDEIGIWDETSSVYRNIYDDEDNDEYEEDCDDYSYDQDEPTYDRYNGSYAQDEMGYSDDDIDTIFDGDPFAYWNID